MNWIFSTLIVLALAYGIYLGLARLIREQLDYNKGR